MNLTVNIDIVHRSACVHLAGDLDYVTTPGVVEALSQLLVEQPTLRELRLACRRLEFCDSAGLSGLLQIHAMTSRAGVQLQLDDRPPHLDRILQITGTLDHLTAPPCGPGATANDDAPNDISGDTEMAGSRDERNA